MRKFNLTLFSLLLTGAVMVLGKGYSFDSLPDAWMPEAKAATSSETQQLPWGELYKKRPPKEGGEGGSRGPVCAIAPASVPLVTQVIWSNRPLFLWQTKEGKRVGKIELRLPGSQEVLWSQTVPENQNTIFYEGESLQPGQSYDWVIFDEEGTTPLYRLKFQVMGEEKRGHFSTELSSLEEQLKQEGATAERIAYARANYFASHQLWSDVLQEAYEVANPSEALTQFMQAIPEQFCGE